MVIHVIDAAAINSLAPDNSIDMFSFEQDIQPLEGRYFAALNSAGLNDRQLSRAQQEITGFSEQLRARKDARRKASLDNALLEQRFESNKLSLDQARDVAKTKREDEQALGSILEQISGINQTSASSEEKRDLVADVAINNAGLMARNQAVRGAINTARETHQTRISDGRSAEARNHNILLSFVSGGQVRATETLLGDRAGTEEGQALIQAARLKGEQLSVNRDAGENAAKNLELGKLRKEQRAERRTQLNVWEKNLSEMENGFDDTNKETKDLNSKSIRQLKVIANQLHNSGGDSPFSEAEWESILNDTIDSQKLFGFVLRGITKAKKLNAAVPARLSPQAPPRLTTNFVQ